MSTLRLPARPPTQAGFAMIAVLLLVGVIATVSATYVRHVVLDAQQSTTSRSALGGTAAVNSGLEFVRRATSVGKAVATTTVVSGEHAASLTLSEVGTDHARFDLQSLDSNGLGATLLAESARFPAPRPGASTPDELPRLDRSTVAALLADSSVPKHYISGQTTLEGVDLEGLVIVENSSALFLRDVVIRGAVVTEDVLRDEPLGDFDSSTVPYLVFDGNVRLEPAGFLPGLSVVMPDGIVTTWTGEARMQVEGDVVAHTVKLNRPGTVRGNIAHVAPLELHAELERPGQTREPRRWAEDLDMGGSFRDEYLAFLPRYSTVSDLTQVVGFWSGDGTSTPAGSGAPQKTR